MFTYSKKRLLTVFAVIMVAIGAPASRGSAGGSWAFTGLMQVARTGFSAALLASGSVLALGGHAASNGELLTSAELFDPVSGAWSLTGSTKYARVFSTLTLLPNGSAIVAGGESALGTATGIPFAELFNPTTGLWSETGSLNQARMDAAAALLKNGELLVAGGRAQCSQANCLGITSAELYTPATGKWSVTGSMNHPRVGHALVALVDGRALVIGGTSNNPTGTLFGAEVFDPSTGKWTETEPMNVNRVYLGATRLGNGTVLAVGGETEHNLGPATATAEIFDSSSNTWTLTGTMSAARSGDLTPVVLKSGRVLIVGGDTTGTSAEVYSPLSRVWTLTDPALVTTGTNLSADETVTRLLNGHVLAAGLQPQVFSPGQ